MKRACACLALVTLECAVWSVALCGASRLETRGAPSNLEPRVVATNGRAHLELPGPLSKALGTEFAGYRVPLPADLSGAWAENRGPESLPFVTWGDYDGDGLTDVVLILLSDREWKMIACRQKPVGKYVFYTLQSGPLGKVNPDNNIEYPKDRVLSTLRKRERLVAVDADSQTGKEIERPIEFDHDAIRLTISETAEAFYYWDGKQYQVQEESTE